MLLPEEENNNFEFLIASADDFTTLRASSWTDPMLAKRVFLAGERQPTATRRLR
jgi:hypothetical protein